MACSWTRDVLKTIWHVIGLNLGLDVAVLDQALALKPKSLTFNWP